MCLSLCKIFNPIINQMNSTKDWDLEDQETFAPNIETLISLFDYQVDLRHMCEVENSNIVPLGIDLSEFYMSVEWDILEVPAVRYVNHIISLFYFN